MLAAIVSTPLILAFCALALRRTSVLVDWIGNLSRWIWEWRFTCSQTQAQTSRVGSRTEIAAILARWLPDAVEAYSSLLIAGASW